LVLTVIKVEEEILSRTIPLAHKVSNIHKFSRYLHYYETSIPKSLSPKEMINSEQHVTFAKQ